MAARSGATMCARQDGSYAFSTPTRPRARRANGPLPARSPRAPILAPLSRRHSGRWNAGPATVSGDCRELRIVVPSDPTDAKSVSGQATVTRTMDGSQASVTVTPKDRLVIGFGDSFTSGEGNPELTAHFSGAPWQNGNLPARALDPVSLADKDTRAQWTDRWCHRSVYSWQIRTALAAALSDPRQSFTILPYGCSGATIPEGILYGYNGVEWSQASDKGIVGSRSEVGLAYQEICQPQAFRSYCVSGAPWCGRTEPPTVGQEQAPGFYDAAGPGLRHAVMRCGPNNVFKRAADALLIDIGINDVGFAGWAAAIILQDPGLRLATHAAAPCFDGTANCTATQKLFATLGRRYDLLRTVLVQYMLPDFGIDPSHVIVAVYPPALENENGAFCPQGNAGLTIATLPSRNPFASACSGSILDRRRARRISGERSGREGRRAGAGQAQREVSSPSRSSLRPSTSSPPIRPIMRSAASARRPTRRVARREGTPVSR